MTTTLPHVPVRILHGNAGGSAEPHSETKTLPEYCICSYRVGAPPHGLIVTLTKEPLHLLSNPPKSLLRPHLLQMPQDTQITIHKPINTICHARILLRRQAT